MSTRLSDPSTATEDLGEVAVGAASELSVPSIDIVRFYATEWTRRIALGHARFYTWQFVAPPTNAGRDMNCVAVSSDGDVIGVMGLNERPFVLGARSVAGAELTTWVLSARARGKGIGQRMMRYLTQRYAVLCGMGITDAALPIYLRSGFQYMRGIPRFVRIYEIEPLLAHLRVDKLGRDLAEKWISQPHAPYDVRAADAADVDYVCRAFFSEYNGFLRDPEHLRWRFADHPVFDYTIVRIDSGSGQCIVVFRHDGAEGMRVLHVVDCFGDRSALPGVCAFIDDEARRSGAHAADVYVTSPRISSMFRPRGWFSTLDDAYLQFTHLFAPPELRIPPTTSLVFHARDAMDAMGDLSKLYMTKADLDLDRPTAERLESSASPA